MNFNLVPSLKHICLVKIATQLWNEGFIVDECTYDIRMNAMQKTRKKMETLPLPTSLKNQLESFIEPIGNQIYDWYLYLSNNYCVKAINLKDLQWTSYGTIDKVKSVQFLLQRDQYVDLKQRYELACTFCLVEEIQDQLQQEMLKRTKLPARAYSSTVQANEQDLVVYYTQYVKKCLKIFGWNSVAYLSSYHEACHLAILSCNPTAAKFFFKRLTFEEKNVILSIQSVPFVEYHYSSFHRLIFAELTCFLLTQMNETEREEALKLRATCVLKSLVAWPYNRYFLLETVNRMWEFLEESDFEDLLYSIFCEIVKNNVDEGCCEYREMYFELWHLSPAQHKKFVVDHLFVINLYKYFRHGGVEMCKLVLNEANATQKERLILQDFWLLQCHVLACKELWNFFKFFVKKCGTRREAIVTFKTQLTTHINLDFDDYETAQFIQFLDNFHPDQIEKSEINP